MLCLASLGTKKKKKKKKKSGGSFQWVYFITFCKIWAPFFASPVNCLPLGAQSVCLGEVGPRDLYTVKCRGRGSQEKVVALAALSSSELFISAN